MNLKSFKIPDDFNRLEFLNNGFTDSEIPNIMVVISLIRIICNFKTRFIDKKEEGVTFARLHSVILRDYILTLGPKCAKFLKKLEKMGVIIIDKSYEVGVKSKGFRLGPKFADSKWSIRDWKTELEKQVPDILERTPVARCKDVFYALWPRACSFFSSWHNMPNGDLKDICKRTHETLKKLTFVRPHNIEYIIESCAQEKQEQHARECEFLEQPLVWTLIDRINSYWAAVEAIEEQRFFISCHDDRFKNFTNRLFTNYTNLKSDLKDFCLLDGEKMTTIDIKCCQPSLLSTFYQDTPEDQKEKEKYMSVILTDDIYNFVGRGIDRDLAKDCMFIVMFAKNNNQVGEFCKNFSEEFPVLAKRIYNEKKTNGYKSVAREMQLMESEIMVKGVLKTLLIDKNIDCLNIHDAIAVKPKDAETATQTIKDCFFKIMGFYPLLETC